jgi:hypothetical protein
MDKAKLISVLQQIKALADEALKELGNRTMPAKNIPRRTQHGGEAKEKLPGHLLALRSGGFFKQPKTATEVHKKLQPTYPCEVDRVAMGLLRIHKRKQLRKATKRVGKRKQVAYVW